MHIETLKPIIFLLAIVIGQILMVYIPYYNKQKADRREFDINYVYTAVIGYICMAVVALQSEQIMSMSLDFTSVMILMFGGAAIQREIFAKATPKQ